MLELKLVAPTILDEQLDQVARTFSIEMSISERSKREFCFRHAFRACERGEWELIDSNAESLSLLVDSLGRTLLLRAINQKEDRIVAGLVERGVGIITKDSCSKMVLEYLAFQAGGDRSDSYAELIRKKLKALFTSNSLVEIFKFEERAAIEYNEVYNFLGNICSFSAPEEGVKILKLKEGKILSLFESILPIHLEYRRAISLLEEQISCSLLSDRVLNIIRGQEDRNQLNEQRRKFYGFIPGYLQDFADERQTIRAIQAEGESELDRLVYKLQQFVTQSPEYTEKEHDLKQMLALVDQLMSSPGIRSDLIQIKKLAELLLYVPENKHQLSSLLFAKAFFCIAKSMLINKETSNRELLIEYFSKSINLFKKSRTSDFSTLAGCYHHRADLYRESAQDSKAEDDYRVLVELTESRRGDNHFFVYKLQSYFGLAVTLSKGGRYEEALIYARKAFLLVEDDEFKENDIGSRISFYYPAIIKILKNLYLSLHDYEQSLIYAQHLVSYFEKQEDKGLEIQALFDLGYINYKTERYADALDSFNKVIQFRHFLPEDVDKFLEDVLERAQEACLT